MFANFQDMNSGWEEILEKLHVTKKNKPNTPRATIIANGFEIIEIIDLSDEAVTVDFIEVPSDNEELFDKNVASVLDDNEMKPKQSNIKRSADLTSVNKPATKKVKSLTHNENSSIKTTANNFAASLNYADLQCLENGKKLYDQVHIIICLF